jgi:hypothetical protein
VGKPGTLDGTAADNSLMHPGQISIHLRMERYGGDEFLSPKYSLEGCKMSSCGILNHSGSGKRGISYQWSSAACLVASALIGSCDAYNSYHEAFAGITRRYLQSPWVGLEGQTLWRPWRVGRL